MRRLTHMHLALLLLAAGVYVVAAEASPYHQSVEKWRQSYEAKLKGDDGWLTVSALLWLHEGENTFGSAADNAVVLPYNYVPAKAGHFDLHQGKIVIHVNPGVSITLNGKRVETMELRPDSKEDRLNIGDLTFFVHASGKRYAIRVKDKNSQLRKNFKGLHWFPVNESYRFNARFVVYPKPREVQITNLLGDRGSTYFPGYVAFMLGDKEYRLDAEDDGSGGLFIVFRDLTSKKETYQAARFLDAAPPKDGHVEIDFNKAYNPPCAYNPYATCPLPTARNRLQIAIPAGEKRYH